MEISYLFAFLIGVLLGLFYFGGLYLTLIFWVVPKSSALIALISFVLRSAVVVYGFVYIAKKSGVTELIISVVSFTLVRWLIVRSKLKFPVNLKNQTSVK